MPCIPSEIRFDSRFIYLDNKFIGRRRIIDEVLALIATLPPLPQLQWRHLWNGRLSSDSYTNIKGVDDFVAQMAGSWQSVDDEPKAARKACAAKRLKCMIVGATENGEDSHLQALATRLGPRTRSVTHVRQVLELGSDELYEGLDSEYEDHKESPRYLSGSSYPVYTASPEQQIPVQDSHHEHQDAQMPIGPTFHSGHMSYQYAPIGGPSAASLSPPGAPVTNEELRRQLVFENNKYTKCKSNSISW